MLRLKNNWIILIYRNAVSLTNNEVSEKQEKHFNTFSWKNQFGWKFSSRLFRSMMLYWKTIQNDCTLSIILLFTWHLFMYFSNPFCLHLSLYLNIYIVMSCKAYLKGNETSKLGSFLSCVSSLI